MKIPKGHAASVAKIAQATPREAVASLLTALLPRVPVQRRPPSPAPDIADADYRRVLEDVPAPTPAFKKLRSKRTRTPTWGVTIEPIVRPYSSGIRAGTGRYAKLAYVWEQYDGLGTPVPLRKLVGSTVYDNRGKEHDLDMASINGMVTRGHIKMNKE